MHNTWGVCVELPLTVSFSLNLSIEEATCPITVKAAFWLEEVQTPILGKVNFFYYFLFIDYIAYMSVLICIGFI